MYSNILTDKVIRESSGMDIDMGLEAIEITINKLYVRDIGKWITL